MRFLLARDGMIYPVEVAQKVDFPTTLLIVFIIGIILITIKYA